MKFTYENVLSAKEYVYGIDWSECRTAEDVLARASKLLDCERLVVALGAFDIWFGISFFMPSTKKCMEANADEFVYENLTRVEVDELVDWDEKKTSVLETNSVILC